MLDHKPVIAQICQTADEIVVLVGEDDQGERNERSRQAHLAAPQIAVGDAEQQVYRRIELLDAGQGVFPAQGADLDA
jgi:nicotinamide mononucleotide adenylyltransferase